MRVGIVRWVVGAKFDSELLQHWPDEISKMIRVQEVSIEIASDKYVVIEMETDDAGQVLYCIRVNCITVFASAWEITGDEASLS